MRIISSRLLSGLIVPLVGIFVSFYLMLAGTMVEDDILNSPEWRKKGVYTPVFDAKATLGIMLQNVFTPGVRGMMSDIMMIQVEDSWHERRWYRLPEYFDIISALQPEWVDGWKTGAWHMAYNVTYEVLHSKFLSLEAQQEEYVWWIDRAVKFLRRGINFNYDKYDLYFELGWLNYHKIKDYEAAIRHFQQAMRIPFHSDYTERMIAYSYQKMGNRKKALEILEELRQDEKYHRNDPEILNILNGNILRLEKEIKEQ